MSYYAYDILFAIVGLLSTLFPIAIFAFVIYMVVKGQKKQQGQVRRMTQNVANSQGVSRPSAARQRNTVRKAAGRNARPARAAGSGLSEKNSMNIREASLLLEDRKNDWLAKQMREEARIYRRGDMLDLGASHNADCEANEVKTLHQMLCDAGILKDNYR